VIFYFRPASRVRAAIEAAFPNLTNSNWYIKSPSSPSYQCIAWAACETKRNWWPMDCPRDLFPPEAYWPSHLPVADESVDNFANAFATLGYERCDRFDFEVGYQKVAIYAVFRNGLWNTKHMARQHFLGHGWLSKIGPSEDIVHPQLSDLEGYLYGTVVQVLRRDWWTALIKGVAWRASIIFFFYRLLHPSWIYSNWKRKRS
jgi:hypothetical protein